MSYALAVDVGTSFTAAAVVRFHQGASPVPECLPLGARGASVPSVVYYPEEGTVLVGEAAERRGLDKPERVVREFKRRIGDDVPIILGTLALQPEEVFATMARWVADRAAEREGGPASAFFLTHPAAWGSHRLSVVRDALAARGLENVTLLSEPEAAALHYASQVRVEEGSTIAVYDLGGGTFDTAVLRKSGSSRFELVGRPEGIEDLGGADFDAAVFSYVAAHSGNALDHLDPVDPSVLGALTRLRRECVEAKEALSADSEASIPVLLPGVQQQVRLVRAEFEALIEEPVRETVEALEHSLAQLHLEPEDLSTVLLIGGSSRIPLVAQLVSEQLGRPIAVDADPKSSICLGAAVAALLAHTAAAEAAALAEAGAAKAEPAPIEAASTGAAPAALAADAVEAAVASSDAPPGPDSSSRPSWSRKYSTAGGAIAGPSRSALHGKGGAHAPKPTVRVTAVAAAAAVLTVLTATAAQSPDGFGNLTAMFVPQAGASTTGGSSGGGGTEAPGPGAAAAAVVPQPLAGIEASARKPFTGEPAPTASAPPAGKQATGGDAAGGATAGGPAAGAPANPPSGAGTGIIPDSLSGATASPTDTPQPLPTSPAPTSPAPTATTAPGTTTPPTTSPAPSPSGTASSGTAPPGTSSPGVPISPTPNSAPAPTDTGTVAPTSGSASPTITPTTMAASGPTADPLVTPTATELTPTPAVAPSPTPEESTSASTDTAVATATTTAPAA